VNRPPTTEGVCDRCGSTQLIQRPDDDPKVIQTRLETFEAQTAPVEAFFAEMGRVTVIDGNQTEEQVFRAIETELKGVETLGSPRY
jgi:adenylate kinase